MDLNALINQLIDNDIKAKLNSLTILSDQLISGNLSAADLKVRQYHIINRFRIKIKFYHFNPQNDVRMKLTNAVLDTINDSNPKVAMLALGVAQTLIEKQHAFSNSNVAFDILIGKLSDTKVSLCHVNIYVCKCKL